MKKVCVVLLLLIAVTTAQAATKIVIGIAGGTGSGKTTLATKLREAFPTKSILISQDSYYKDLSHLSFEERSKVNFDHLDSLDFALLQKHLISLKNNEAINQPIYNFRTHSREPEGIKVEPAELIIVEGILLFAAPEVCDLFDLKFFVDTDEDVRLLRRIQRDITERARTFESVRDQYLATVKPMHALFVEPSKKKADMIIPHGGENEAAVAVITTKLKEVLSKKTSYQMAKDGSK